MIRQLITAALTITSVLILARQCRKPAWWLGRLVIRDMNARHSRVTDWGLAHVAVERAFVVLDVGCGGGRTVQKLAAMAADGRVSGIDYSPASVEVARGTNAELIAAGRVDIQQGTVSQLPFPPSTFDIVTAVETFYYWPNQESDLREVLRVLRPGGRLVVIAEAYKGQRFWWAVWPAMALLRAHYLSLGGHRDVFAAAGFTEIVAFEQRARGWMCMVGRKPVAL